MPRGTILAFAPGKWGWPDFAGSPRYHLWSLAGRGWQVLYVEPPGTIQSRHRWSAPDRAFHVLRPRTLLPFRFGAAPNPQVLARWARFASRHLAAEGGKELARLGWKADVAWLGAPWHASLAEHLPAGLPIVHHVYDELSKSPARAAWQQAELWRWEQRLHQRADLILCSSQSQREAREGRWVELLENAVDDDWIDTCSRPPTIPHPGPEIPSRSHPGQRRIAYGGVVDHRLDGEWFGELARAFPGDLICFMGKMDATCPAAIRQMDLRAGNVWFSDSVPYRAYPRLYSECDVLVFAHVESEFTSAMYPEKLNEYLATGKPIVARDLPNVRRLAGEAGHPAAIRLAGNAEGFVAAVAQALGEDDPSAREARIALARRHSWSVEAARLEDFLCRLLGPGIGPQG